MQKCDGFFGEYGGQFVPETLVPALYNLGKEFLRLKKDRKFNKKLSGYLRDYAGRPTPVYFAGNLSEKYSINIYFKREDLLHTGAHKINNTLGQALLAKYMGRTRIIAETGAGQHGLATATAAALLGLKCVIYMGAVDVSRQSVNVKKMQTLGAEVRIVREGSQTLKEAINAALRDWVANIVDTHYLLGSAVGPHPFPSIVAYFQSVIGREARAEFKKMGFLPDAVVACVGGGSNAIGIFQVFLNDSSELVGVEAGGTGDMPGQHARTIGLGKPGILHGALSYLLQDKDFQVSDVHSVSAGLDYPGVGPEHSFLKDSGRVKYEYVRDSEAVSAFYELSRLEGIIPALEPSHAIAYVLKNKKRFRRKTVLINLSGRGDKDLDIVFNYPGRKK